MPRSDRSTFDGAPTEGSPSDGPLPDESIEPSRSWDPLDDETGRARRRQTHWTWHSRPSWGRRAVAAFPVVAAVLSIVLVAESTAASQSVIDQFQSVTGTGGATLLVSTPASTGPVQSAPGQFADYHGVTFDAPGSATTRIPESTSLAIPAYPGWEANGSAGAANAFATIDGGLLNVGVVRPTNDFRGWFLTATSATPTNCAFQFDAMSPPPVASSTPGAVGELVMAVQTSDTVTTGDINYVVVAEIVDPGGRRSLLTGYSLGHLSHAVEHVLKEVPWTAGPLDVSIESNGSNQLAVWVDGALFYRATDLHMGIAPPFEPYLEVQARHTAYTVAFRGYSSSCAPDIAVSNLTDGSTVRLGNLHAVARGGSAVLPLAQSAVPVTGALTLSESGSSQLITFARRTFWPGTRLSFEPGT